MHACPQGPPANRLPTCCSRSYASSVRSYSFLMWNDSCRWLCGAGRDRCSGAARGMRKALGKPVPPRLPCRRRPATRQGSSTTRPSLAHVGHALWRVERTAHVGPQLALAHLARRVRVSCRLGACMHFQVWGYIRVRKYGRMHNQLQCHAWGHAQILHFQTR